MNTKKDKSTAQKNLRGESKILAALRGIYISKTFKAAMELELFTVLAEKPMTCDEIKANLNLHGRGLYDFLDTLVSLELLDRNGEGQNATYHNTEESSFFLVKDQPNYVGWWLPNKMSVLEQNWGELAEALKTGMPQRQDIKDTGKSLFDLNYDSKEKSRIFIGGMNLAQMGSFSDFAKRFDFSKFHSSCDVGGANGFLSILIAQYNKHLKLNTFDLPSLEPLAKEKISEVGLTDRISVISGNFFENDLPKADIITMGFILHDWNLEEKKLLILKAYTALPEGGVLVVLESFIDNERRLNTTGLLMSLHMLLVTDGGFDYTPADFSSWAIEVGFKKTEVMPLRGESSAVIAYK